MLTIMQYLKRELSPSSATAFMAEWRSLTEEDKADLKKWAEVEMKVLGIEVKR